MNLLKKTKFIEKNEIYDEFMMKNEIYDKFIENSKLSRKT